MGIDAEKQAASDPFLSLYKYPCILLTTFRKNGQGVPTPVAFGRGEGKLYVITIKNSGKCKRLRNNGRVTIAPCTRRGQVLGETIEARAYELPASEFPKAKASLRKSMGPIYYIVNVIYTLRRIQSTFLAIEAGVTS